MSDIFFGLGAVLLIVIGAVSLSLQGLIATSLRSDAPGPHETAQAVETLVKTDGTTRILANASGLTLFKFNMDPQPVALSQILSASVLFEDVSVAPMVFVAPDGGEAAFLLFSRHAQRNARPWPTVRLVTQCRSLVQTNSQTVQCQP